MIISVEGIKRITQEARPRPARGELSVMVSVTSLPGGSSKPSTLNFSSLVPMTFSNGRRSRSGVVSALEKSVNLSAALLLKSAS